MAWYKPDSYVRPCARSRPNPGQGANQPYIPYSTVDFEIAIATSRKQTDAHAKIAGHLSARATIQVVIITKIWAFWAFCNAPGIPEYQIHLPAAALCDGVPPGAPLSNPQGLALNIWTIQQRGGKILLKNPANDENIGPTAIRG